MHNCKKIMIALVGILINIVAIAQEQVADSTQTGVMRSSGKIYVVVAVLLTILAGIVFYMARLDNKISKMEKES